MEMINKQRLKYDDRDCDIVSRCQMDIFEEAYDKGFDMSMERLLEDFHLK